MINTNDDGKDLIRKLSSSIIFDATGDSIKVHCPVTLNMQPPVVDNVACRYRGTCTCKSHILPSGGDCPQSLNMKRSPSRMITNQSYTQKKVSAEIILPCYQKGP